MLWQKMPSDKKIRKLVCTKKGITGKAYLYKGRKKKMKGKMGEVEKKRAKGCHVYNSPFSEFEKLQSTIKFNRYFVTPNRVKHQLVTIIMSASHGYARLCRSSWRSRRMRGTPDVSGHMDTSNHEEILLYYLLYYAKYSRSKLQWSREPSTTRFIL